eukprot:2655514-Pleurochrysis_carterae.AAC.1
MTRSSVGWNATLKTSPMCAEKTCCSADEGVATCSSVRWRVDQSRTEPSAHADASIEPSLRALSCHVREACSNRRPSGRPRHACRRCHARTRGAKARGSSMPLCVRDGCSCGLCECLRAAREEACGRPSACVRAHRRARAQARARLCKPAHLRMIDAGRRCRLSKATE